MDHLGVFAKYWQPGEVKTRLAKSLGAKNASRVYLTFLQHILLRFSKIEARRSLWIWPVSARKYFLELMRRLDIAENVWEIAAQCPGDLGQRMKFFFDRTFAQSVQRPNQHVASPQKVILVGSDSPDLPDSILTDAFRQLDQHEVVIGPSHDGGYYLIGMRDSTYPIFNEVQWSSPQVLPKTRELLDSQGISYRLLPEWHDIDDLADLQNAATRLASLIDQHPSWSLLYQEVLAALQYETPSND